MIGPVNGPLWHIGVGEVSNRPYYGFHVQILESHGGQDHTWIQHGARCRPKRSGRRPKLSSGTWDIKMFAALLTPFDDTYRQEAAASHLDRLVDTFRDLIGCWDWDRFAIRNEAMWVDGMCGSVDGPLKSMQRRPVSLTLYSKLIA